MRLLKGDMAVLNGGAHRASASASLCSLFSRLPLLTLFLAPLFLITASRAQAAGEYQLKTLFLFNFTQFTDWPTNTFATNTTFVIGVLGTDPFGPILDETVQEEKAHGVPIVIQRYRRVEEIKTCHILFIGQSEARRLDRILASLKGRPILTASDIEGAAYGGVMVRFVTEDDKIRLRINLDAVKESGLSISSKLLRAAEIVSPKTQ